MPSGAQMQHAVQQLARDVELGDSEGRRRTWRKVTTLMTACGVHRLTRTVQKEIAEALSDAGLICEPPFESIDRAATVRLSMRVPNVRWKRDSQSHDAVADFGGGLRSMAPSPRRSESALRLSVWQPAQRPQIIADDDTYTHGSDEILHIGIDPNSVRADIDSLHQALVVHCGETVTLSMVRDLLEADSLPKTSFHPQGLRLLSTFGVEATDALTQEEEESAISGSTAGKLIFQPTEMIIGPTWLVTCWHDAQHVAPSSPLRGGPTILRDAVMDQVRDSWVTQDLRTPEDLGVLIATELARGYEHAVALVTAWQEQWEMAFASEEPCEPQSLIPIRRQLAEYRTRLQGLSMAQHGVHGRGKSAASTAPAVSLGLDELVDRSLQSVELLIRQVRSGVESVRMLQIARQQAQASEQQAQSRKLQDRLTLLGGVLLGPGLIASIFGANVELPGRDRLLGTIIMIFVMLTVIVLPIFLMRRSFLPDATHSSDSTVTSSQTRLSSS